MESYILVVGRDRPCEEGQVIVPVHKVQRDLKATGYCVVVTCDGNEALRRAEEHPPAVTIVTDRIFPDEHGDRFVRELNHLNLPMGMFFIEPPHLRQEGFHFGIRCEAKCEYYELMSQGYGGDVYLPFPYKPFELVDLTCRFVECIIRLRVSGLEEAGK